MGLFQKLEKDELEATCAEQVEDLHRLFVQWFRGTRPLEELQLELRRRLSSSFSHVAPNGQFLSGRQVLLGHLEDKYGCYNDRVFEIDIYNVQLVWSDGEKFLVTYEEWQSWQQEVDENGEKLDVNQTQQFGRLSTCLLERGNGSENEEKKGYLTGDEPFRWIHVHETWLEDEAPAPDARRASSMRRATTPRVTDEDTVMTGPQPPASPSEGSGDSADASPQHSPLVRENKSNKGVAMLAAAFSQTKEKEGSLRESERDRRGSVHEKVIVLISKESMTRDQLAYQEKVVLILRQERIPYQVLNADNSANPMRNELLALSYRKGDYPRIFVSTGTTNTFWGGWERFNDAHKSGKLRDELQIRSEGDHEESESSNRAAETVAALAAVTGMAGSSGRKATTKKQNSDHSSDSDEGENVKPPVPPSSRDDILFFEPSERDESENGYGNGNDRGKSNDNESEAGNMEDLDPKEQAFMEASRGILVFEQDDGNRVNKDRESAAVLAASKAENAAKGELPVVSQESTPIPNDISKKRHISVRLDKYAKPIMWEGALVGISIAGFDIGTSQGPIADEAWYKENGAAMELISQSPSTPRPQRRICLPEMVYSIAHVALEGNGVWLSWDAQAALESWSKCHSMIPHMSRLPYHGVNVMKSDNARFWEQRRKHVTSDDAVSSVFHYDWTYSTPYCGTMEGGEWIELDESGMRMELLTDQSVPILFFDEIILYEDDLHDNGQAQYAVKLRVMPTCAYVLARLFVRVDNVILRVRETRLLVDFFGIKPQIYRDVTWKECLWENLAELGLPTDVRPWHYNGRETSDWHGLIRALPEVDPPKDIIFKNAVLEYPGKSGGMSSEL